MIQTLERVNFESVLDELFTVGEAASFLRVSKARVRRMLLDKRFPTAIRKGRNWLIPKKDVEIYSRERKTGYPKGRKRKPRVPST